MLLHSLEKQPVVTLNICTFWKVTPKKGVWKRTTGNRHPHNDRKAVVCLGRVTTPLAPPPPRPAAADHPKREAHLPWQSEVRGQTAVQNSSLELVLALRLARWHFSRCPVTTRVTRVKASRSDHLSTAGDLRKGKSKSKHHLETPCAFERRARGEEGLGRMTGGAEDLWL